MSARRIIFLLAVLILPVDVKADTIQITGGLLTTTGGTNGSGTLTLEGDRGFTFTSNFGLPFVLFGPAQCLVCGPPASTTLGVGGTLVGNDLIGTATLDGTTYLNVGSLAVNESMFVQLAGTALVLPGATGTSTLTLFAPFTMTGIFFYGLTSVDLTGSGMAAITLAAVDSGLTGLTGLPPWQFQSASYDFTPVPEPGTLTLVLLGAAGALRRLRAAR